MQALILRTDLICHSLLNMAEAPQPFDDLRALPVKLLEESREELGQLAAFVGAGRLGEGADLGLRLVDRHAPGRDFSGEIHDVGILAPDDALDRRSRPDS